MTVIRSASGTRVDCDTCGEHASSIATRIDDLRSRTGFVLHAGQDWCPSCWSDRYAERLPTGPPRPGDDGPAAA